MKVTKTKPVVLGRDCCLCRHYVHKYGVECLFLAERPADKKEGFDHWMRTSAMSPCVDDDNKSVGFGTLLWQPDPPPKRKERGKRR